MGCAMYFRLWGGRENVNTLFLWILNKRDTHNRIHPLHCTCDCNTVSTHADILYVCDVALLLMRECSQIKCILTVS